MAESRIALVDLGGTWARVALGTAEGRLLDRRQERTNHDTGPEGVIDQIVTMITQAAAGTDLSLVVAGTPGPLDPRTGIVYEAPNMPGWTEVHIRDDLQRRLGVPALVLNDANAAALGEYEFGAGRGYRSMVFLTVSTGIGGGVVVDGELLVGATGTAGEVGHMSIDRHGPLCKCGNVGCLEALASGTAIGRRFRERLAEGATSKVTEWTDSPSGADVSRAAAEGDPLAAAVFRDAAEALGLGIVNCVHVFNPDVVVLGGGVSTSGPLLFDPMEAIVDRHAMRLPRGAVKIVPAQLGDDAGLFGCLAVAQRAATENAGDRVS